LKESTETVDVTAAFENLELLAANPHLPRQQIPLDRAVATLLDIHWLEQHGHLVSDEDNGMVFAFSRPCPTEPGKRVGFVRQTVDPTPGQETAFARALRGAIDGGITKVEKDPE
jgi:hypothetical protein